MGGPLSSAVDAAANIRLAQNENRWAMDAANTAWNRDQQAATTAFERSSGETQINRDFQERMRGSQYQTSMADMKKAGLNPILAYKQGGAGTPAGGAATAAKAIAPTAKTAGSRMKSDFSILEMKGQMANIGLLGQQQNSAEAQARYLDAQASGVEWDNYLKLIGKQAADELLNSAKSVNWRHVKDNLFGMYDPEELQKNFGKSGRAIMEKFGRKKQ